MMIALPEKAIAATTTSAVPTRRERRSVIAVLDQKKKRTRRGVLGSSRRRPEAGRRSHLRIQGRGSILVVGMREGYGVARCCRMRNVTCWPPAALQMQPYSCNQGMLALTSRRLEESESAVRHVAAAGHAMTSLT